MSHFPSSVFYTFEELSHFNQIQNSRLQTLSIWKSLKSENLSISTALAEDQLDLTLIPVFSSGE